MICGDAQGSVWGGGGEGCGEVGAGAGPEAGHSQDRGPGALRIPHQVSIVIHTTQYPGQPDGPFHFVKSPVLWIRNDLFRIRIQLWIFRVPAPDSTYFI